MSQSDCYKILGCKFKIFKDGAHRFASQIWLPAKEKDKMFKNLTEKAIKAIMLFGQIEGLSTLHLHGNYDFCFEKGSAFTWEELAPKIIEVIEKMNQS